MYKVCISLNYIITGPPTHSVRGGSIVLLVGVGPHLSSSSVTLHGGPEGGFTRAGQGCHAPPV